MERLPPQTREELSDEKQGLYDLMRRIADKSFGPNGQTFVYEDDRGAFTGPFPFFLYVRPEFHGRAERNV